MKWRKMEIGVHKEEPVASEILQYAYALSISLHPFILAFYFLISKTFRLPEKESFTQAISNIPTISESKENLPKLNKMISGSVLVSYK